MKKIRNCAVAGMLLLFAAACADLDVTNPNDADKEQAIRTALDVQSLVSGSFQTWYNATNHATNSPSLLLSHQAFQHSSSAANFGMLSYPALPRFAVNNTVTHQDYAQIANAWSVHYRALAAIADGLRAINTDEAVRTGLGSANVARARAFGKFMQGLSHGSLAVLYDRGYVVDENITSIDESGNPVLLGEPVSSQAMLNAAIGYLDQAIAATQGQTWTIPAAWMSVDVPAARLAQLASSFKAQFRAANARTAEQRAAVDWAKVKAEIDAGIGATFNIDQNYIYTNWLGAQYNALYIFANTFTRANYMIHGMADQSGRYQNWLSLPVPDRHPDRAGPGGSTARFLIVTPDRRFVRGDTVMGAMTNVSGADTLRLYRNQACGSTVNCTIVRPAATPTATRTLDTVAFSNRGRNLYYNGGALWSQAGRGTWRWAYYNPVQTNAADFPRSAEPLITLAEMELLKAEAHFRLGEIPAAVAIINKYRTQAGLNATDASGTNTSCVPRLPNGTCGNLFEMLKWEKRMETMFQGPYMAGWYFDSRGWGDLYEGTQLELPIPEQEYITLGLGDPYTFGGPGGHSSAPTSTYAWPHE